MIKIPKEQSDWMKSNFFLSKKDFPSDFLDPKDFLETICGEQYFRGLDYKGDSMSFVDDCLCSFSISPENKNKFNRIFTQLHNYWIKEALKKEYYELLVNLNELNENFIEFVKQADDQQAEYNVIHLLIDAGVYESRWV